MASISGNVGGVAASGAQVQIDQVGGAPGPTAWAVADANGAYSFAGLVPGTYLITAFSPDATHVYRKSLSVSLTSGNVIDANLVLSLLNSSNASS